MLLAQRLQLRQAALGWLVPCRVATSAEEFQAIARLRYETYIKEQHVDVKGADHQHEQLWQPEDEAPDVLHFYAGPQHAPLGAMRARVWAPGAVPQAYWEGYSLDLLPDAARRTVCEVSQLMVRPSLRGTAAMAALTGYSVYEVVRRYRNDLVVAASVPGLLRRYESIGLRHFGGRPLGMPRGVVLPLLGLTNDVAHTLRIGSPWYPALRRLQREGLLPEDLPQYRAQIERDRSVVSEPSEVRAELLRLSQEGSSRFLQDLPPAVIARLAGYGVILDVPAGLSLCREEVADREVYVALSGTFEVYRNGQRLAQIGPGQMFGEMALLSKRGRRSAEVRVASAGRVLVLRRKFLADMYEEDAGAGRQVYEGLVQELLRKLDGGGGQDQVGGMPDGPAGCGPSGPRDAAA